MMGDPVQSLSKTVHPEVAGPKLQQNLMECASCGVRSPGWETGSELRTIQT